ncbi:hypothetical protein [Psychrobacter lutiphocae]|uniref:hypothetical protein n=1 Tax=Psychrobacter lutiphocae TaxID=540500 RepID=UPI00037CC683|nr:hypothetical protein [Psychrobacter lutiphocae]
MTSLITLFKFIGQLAEWLLEYIKTTMFIFYVVNVFFWVYQDGFGFFSALFFSLISTPVSGVLLILPIFMIAGINILLKDQQSLNH